MSKRTKHPLVRVLRCPPWQPCACGRGHQARLELVDSQGKPRGRFCLLCLPEHYRALQQAERKHETEK